MEPTEQPGQPSDPQTHLAPESSAGAGPGGNSDGGDRYGGVLASGTPEWRGFVSLVLRPTASLPPRPGSSSR